jgi:hypothetical protein
MNASGMFRGVTIVIALASVSAPFGHAQTTGGERQSTTQPLSEPASGPTVYQFAVHPRPAPTPALKYELLPEPMVQVPGNAATAWLLTFEQLSQNADAKLGANGSDTVFDDLDLPAERFAAKRDEVEKFLGGFSAIFRSSDVAARREQCQWDLPLREEGFDLLLPHLSTARRLSNLLALRARLRIAAGDWDGAARALQTGFALSRDLTQQAVIVQELVSSAVCARLMRVVEEWQQHPDAPNLYWALAGFPKPFEDFRAAMQLERTSLSNTFPQLRGLNDAGLSERDWLDFQDRMNAYLAQSGISNHNRFQIVAQAVYLFPKAKKFLIDQGMEAAKVDAMPTRQVLAEYELGEYRRWSDDMVKWTNLPFWQAWDGMQRTNDAFRHSDPSTIPLLSFLPAVSRAYLSAAKLDRQIAAAQTIEAIRAYAAAHEGKVPERLSDLTDMPAPVDPVTGREFDYAAQQAREGSEARVTLDCPAPPGAMPTDAARYEVTFLRQR